MAYQTPIPGAAGYGQANLLARRAYDNAMARLQQRRSRTLQTYGYQRDASGNLSVDPHNEYGQYQQMLRSQDIGSRRLGAQQRSGGWGQGSGYFGAQREQQQYEQGAQQRQLGTALTDEMFDISQGEQEAAYGRDQALYQAELEAAQQAIQQGNFNPADYSGMDIPDYGEPAPPRPQPKRMPTIHQRGKGQLLRRRARGRRR